MQDDAAPQNGSVLLELDNLQVFYFMDSSRIVKAVDKVSFRLMHGETLGIVGESGSGKSTLGRAIMRTLDQPGRIVGGTISFKGKDLLALPENEMRRLRGSEISMIFQDPTTSLDPLFTIGNQLIGTLNAHEQLSKKDKVNRVTDVLGMVGITDIDGVLKSYPSDFSAGFRQRIMIALAMLCRPYLVIADEPTTTLGATIQAQVLDSLDEIRQRFKTAIIFITHDFGVVSQFASKIMVMYAGKCIEYGPKEELLLHPKHPYTIGLIRSVPLIEARRSKRLKSIRGFPPDMLNLPTGCPFAPRCDFAQDKCLQVIPSLTPVDENHFHACHFPVDFDTREELVIEEGEHGR